MAINRRMRSFPPGHIQGDIRAEATRDVQPARNRVDADNERRPLQLRTSRGTEADRSLRKNRDRIIGRTG